MIDNFFDLIIWILLLGIGFGIGYTVGTGNTADLCIAATEACK